MIESTRSDIRRARALARVLDSAVGVPGTSLRIGLDAVLGLMPGAGDLVGAALSGYIVLAAARNGAPAMVLGRMLVHVLIDTAIGAIPVLGDVFDVAYQANVRNVELLERFAAQPAQVTQGSRRWAAILTLVVLLALIAIGAVIVLLASAVWRMLTG